LRPYDEIYELLFLRSRPKEAFNRIGSNNDPEARLLKAYSLLFMDNLRGVERIFKTLDTPDTLVGRALIDMKKLRFSEGLHKLQNYLEVGQNPYLKAEAFYLLLNLLMLTGNLTDFELYYQQLMEFSIIHDLPSYQWMAEVHRAKLQVVHGNIEGAISLLEVSRKGLKEQNNIGRQIIPTIKLAYYKAYIGDTGEVLSLLDEAISLAKITGSHLLQGLAYYYTYIVKSLLGMHDSESYNMAWTFIELSEDRIMQTEIQIDKIVDLIKGKDLDLARRELQSLLSSLRETDYEYKIPTLLYLMAEVELMGRNPEKVLEIVDEFMNGHFLKRKYLTLEMMALRSSALFRLNRRREAYEEFLKMLEFTEQHNLYHYWTTDVEDTLNKLKPIIEKYLRNHKSNLPPYLLKLVLEGNFTIKNPLKVDLSAASRYLDFDTVKKHLNTLKSMNPNFPEIYASKLRYKINLLGGFSIKIGSKTVREEDFDRPIHARLLKYLILHRGISLPKGKIIEDIWRNKQTAKTHRTLNTILSHIRKILHPLGEKNLSIRGSKGEVGFYPDDRFEIDIDEFEKKVKKARMEAWHDIEKGKALLKEAIELYKGDLLPADDDEWIELERERLRTAYSQALFLLADLLHKEGKTLMAIALLEEALYKTADPDIFRTLLKYLEKENLRGKIEYWKGYIDRLLS